MTSLSKIIGVKPCTQCSLEKPFAEFKLKRNGKYHSWCHGCRRDYSRNLAKTPEQQVKRKAWRDTHKSEITLRNKTLWANNKARYEPARQRWAAENRDAMLAYQHERGRTFREWVDSMKAGKPCVDCLGQFPPYVMEYDHVRGEKRHNIGKMANHKRERVLEEIAKCELVCCACHRIRSHNRRGYSKTPKFVKFRAWMDSLKKNPCTDCGITLHPVAMDFDHVRGEKIEGISSMYGWDQCKVLDELTKCELVCANCHRERTVSALKRGSSSALSMAACS